MNITQTLRSAGRALLRNKMRSFLTALGIVIGVFAVIAMVAIGDGANARVQKSFEAMGSDMLIILPGSTNKGGAFGGFGTMPTLTWDDLRTIRTEASAVHYAAASLRTSSQMQSELQNWNTSITGTSPEFFQIRKWPIASGRGLVQADVDGGARVVVLGQTVADKLFGAGVSPVSRTVRINGAPFVVVGVLSKKGQSAHGQDNDDGAFIPQTTFQAKIQGGLQKYLQGMIMVAAASPEALSHAQSQITSILRDRHHVAAGAADDFSIRNLAEMADAMQEGTATLRTLLASVAAVSLLVGGIGIMNIMLVSVTERTREIGIRMAVGAKRRDIGAQFLVEALMLSVLGGVIGIVLGLTAGHIAATRFGWPMVYRVDVIVVATAFSGLIGVGFGLYPARKASQLDPIDAMRYE